ncbi:hypothetical protein L2E82_02642 [Cichorium intybus]|uniref:Uncharacterized protein n=1 Tax=Cichorium intybus TaxID=13427 RepID=A0ACB9H324_CICIN|nr:hypothetical protein L2E82_02642 [Cichorium intybus]
MASAAEMINGCVSLSSSSSATWGKLRNSHKKKAARGSGGGDSRFRVRCVSTSHLSSDPYKTLSIRPGASESEVKKAFRQLALKYHPDVCREAIAESSFIKSTKPTMVADISDTEMSLNKVLIDGRRININVAKYGEKNNFDENFNRDFGAKSKLGEKITSSTKRFASNGGHLHGCLCVTGKPSCQKLAIGRRNELGNGAKFEIRRYRSRSD